jgi:predicted branched-subunit amino acid permease
MRPQKEKIDYAYISLSFLLSIMFLVILLSKNNEDELLYNSNIYLLASLMSFILYSYHKSFRLCGFLLVILFMYFIKKNYLRRI